MVSRLVSSAVALLATLLLAGCTPAILTQTKAPSSLLLEAEPRVAAAPRRTGHTLMVAAPEAQAGFDGQRMAYTKTPLTLDYYTQSEWADTPARMLSPLVVRTLESTGALRAVVSAPSPVPIELRLDLQLLRLQQEFFRKPSEVRLELRAKLFDVRRGQVLATRVIETVAPAPSEDAYGGARAASRATAAALEELAAFVVASLPPG
jgi:cholesterol transport system auxiliary component